MKKAQYLLPAVATAAALLAHPALGADRSITKAQLQPTSINWTGFYLGAEAGAAGTMNRAPAITDSVLQAGALVGGLTGYNYQFSNAVAGVDVTLGALLAQRTGSVAGGGITTSQNSYLATASGRLGVTLGMSNATLLYGKVGAAWTKSDFGPGVGSVARSGLLLGAGWDYAWTQNWFSRFEYNFINLGTQTITGVDVKGTAHALKLGVAYKF